MPDNSYVVLDLAVSGPPMTLLLAGADGKTAASTVAKPDAAGRLRVFVRTGGVRYVGVTSGDSKMSSYLLTIKTQAT